MQTKQPCLVFLLMEHDSRADLLETLHKDSSWDVPSPCVVKPFCAPSSVPLPMLKWERYPEKLQDIPHQVGEDLGGIILWIIQVWFGKWGVGVLLKIPFFPSSHLCSNVWGMLTWSAVCSCPLPGREETKSWSQTVYWNPAFAGCLGTLGHVKLLTQGWVQFCSSICSLDLYH